MAKFKKGQIPWNKGLPKEQQPAFGNSNMLDKNHTDETKKKISEARKGRKHTEETKRKIAEAHIGNKHRLGCKHTDETKRKISESHIGDKNYNWNPNREEVTHNRRNDAEYKQWRKEVRKRDRNECRLKNDECCDIIITHHIKPWALYKELRYEVSNGIVLCETHHPRTRKLEIEMIPILEEIINLKN